MTPGLLGIPDHPHVRLLSLTLSAKFLSVCKTPLPCEVICPQVPGLGRRSLWAVTEIEHSFQVDHQAARPPGPTQGQALGTQVPFPIGTWTSKAHTASSPRNLLRALGGARQWGAGRRRNVVQASRRAGFSREAAGLGLEVAVPDFSKLAVQMSCPTLPVGRLPPGLGTELLSPSVQHPPGLSLTALHIHLGSHSP